MSTHSNAQLFTMLAAANLVLVPAVIVAALFVDLYLAFSYYEKAGWVITVTIALASLLCSGGLCMGIWEMVARQQSALPVSFAYVVQVSACAIPFSVTVEVIQILRGATLENISGSLANTVSAVIFGIGAFGVGASLLLAAILAWFCYCRAVSIQCGAAAIVVVATGIGSAIGSGSEGGVVASALYGESSLRFTSIILHGISWIYCSLLLFWAPWLRRNAWRDAAACSRCGYDLTANMSGYCPECGSSILCEEDKQGQ